MAVGQEGSVGLLRLLQTLGYGPRPAKQQSRLADITTRREDSPQAMRDLALRDLQHQVFTRALIERFGPVWGRLLAFGAIPAWQGAKAATQYTGSFGREASGMLPSGMQPHQGTPPSWGQLGTGWGPIFRPEEPMGLPPQTRYRPDLGGP